jgi:sec-independent protein translocase protein TatA
MHTLFAIGMPSGGEWFWVFGVFILLFGGAKLPALAKGLGRSVGEFKKAKEEFSKELESSSDTSKSSDNPPLNGTKKS